MAPTGTVDVRHYHMNLVINIGYMSGVFITWRFNLIEKFIGSRQWNVKCFYHGIDAIITLIAEVLILIIG